MEHIPVLRQEVRDYMDLKGDEVVVDGTLGLGGHSYDVLSQLSSVIYMLLIKMKEI